MDEKIVEDMLDELLPSLEALEARNEAVLQFLKEKGIAPEDQLAPYLEQSRNASNVRWRAVHLRMKRLLLSAIEQEEKRGEEESSAKHETHPEAAKPEAQEREMRRDEPEHRSTRTAHSNNKAAGEQRTDRLREGAPDQEAKKDAA